MKTYSVWTEEVIIKYIEVEAETSAHAEEKVRKMYEEYGHSDFAKKVDEMNFMVQHVEVKHA